MVLWIEVALVLFGMDVLGRLIFAYDKDLEPRSPFYKAVSMVVSVAMLTWGLCLLHGGRSVP